MKTYCRGLVIDKHFIYQAYNKWLSAEAGRRNSWRIEKEYGSIHDLVEELHYEINNRCLSFRPIHYYKRQEKISNKIRIIGVQSVKQQIVDYVAIIALEPLLRSKIGFYQVSSTPGKGQLFTAKTIHKWVQYEGYWVHLDVRQCYPSIQHDLIMDILIKHIRNLDVLYICESILNTYTDGGLDIGSYFSLKMAQLVLSFGYHHVENLHKIRRNEYHSLIEHQLWYMDDILLMSRDKRDLRVSIRSLEDYLFNELGLTIKPWKICLVGDEEPIDMAGFIVRPNRITLRSSIFIRASRSARDFDKYPSLKRARRVSAYWGWLIHSNSQDFINRHQFTYRQKRASRLVSMEDRKHNANKILDSSG